VHLVHDDCDFDVTLAQFPRENQALAFYAAGREIMKIDCRGQLPGNRMLQGLPRLGLQFHFRINFVQPNPVMK